MNPKHISSLVDRPIWIRDLKEAVDSHLRFSPLKTSNAASLCLPLPLPLVTLFHNIVDDLNVHYLIDGCSTGRFLSRLGMVWVWNLQAGVLCKYLPSRGRLLYIRPAVSLFPIWLGWPGLFWRERKQCRYLFHIIWWSSIIIHFTIWKIYFAKRKRVFC